MSPAELDSRIVPKRRLTLLATVLLAGTLAGCSPATSVTVTNPIRAALHVTSAGLCENLAAVAVPRGLSVRPDGVRHVKADGRVFSQSDSARVALSDSGFSDGWFFFCPGSYQLHVRAYGLGIGAMNEVALGVTLSPGQAYALSANHDMPILTPLSPSDPLVAALIARQSQGATPLPLPTAPGFLAEKGIRVFMFARIERVDHSRQENLLAFETREGGYPGMPVYALGVATDTPRWPLTVIFPPDLQHRFRPYGGEVEFQWKLHPFEAGDSTTLLYRAGMVASVQPSGWGDTAVLVEAEELHAFGKGSWWIHDARLTSKGDALVFSACPYGQGEKGCHIGKKTLTTRAVVDLGVGKFFALAPDGHTVASSAPGEGEVIRLTSLVEGGSAPSVIPTGKTARDIAWSPDGNLIAFAGDGGVSVLRLSDKKTAPVLKAQTSADQRHGGAVSWAPDNRLYLVMHADEWNDEIWRVKVLANAF
jgi:hypothetical protein